MTEVENEILLHIKNGLDTTPEVLTFYQGEVYDPPRSNLPCIMLWGSNTSLRAYDTANDQAIYTIKIRVVFSVASVLNASGVPADGNGIVQMQASLQVKNIIEERDAVTHNLLPTCILGIIRNKMTIKGVTYTFNNEVSVNYGNLANVKFPHTAAEVTFKVTAALLRRPGI